MVYSRWNHLSPSSLQAIRKLYDVPQERGRPASLAKVARHFWDHRSVGGPAAPAPVPAAVQRQSARATNPASYRRQPSAAPTSAVAAAVVPDSDDDDASVHLAIPSRAASPELISPSQPGPRVARQTRVTSSHQAGLDAPYDVVIALFPSDLWRVAFDRTFSWDLPKKKQMCSLG